MGSQPSIRTLQLVTIVWMKLYALFLSIWFEMCWQSMTIESMIFEKENTYLSLFLYSNLLMLRNNTNLQLIKFQFVECIWKTTTCTLFGLLVEEQYHIPVLFTCNHQIHLMWKIWQFRLILSICTLRTCTNCHIALFVSEYIYITL
jgi:hypothetical protein